MVIPCLTFLKETEIGRREVVKEKEIKLAKKYNQVGENLFG